MSNCIFLDVRQVVLIMWLQTDRKTFDLSFRFTISFLVTGYTTTHYRLYTTTATSTCSIIMNNNRKIITILSISVLLKDRRFLTKLRSDFNSYFSTYTTLYIVYGTIHQQSLVPFNYNRSTGGPEGTKIFISRNT